MPELLARLVGGKSAILNWHHRDGDFEALSYSYFTPEFIEAYGKAWASHDLWCLAGSRPSHLNRFFILEQLVPRVAWANSAIYNEFLRVEGTDTFQCLGGAFSTPWGEGFLGIHRGTNAAPFGDAELATLQRHARDLGRMLHVKGEIAAARHNAARAKAALDAIALGVVTVSRDGRLLDANSLADAVLTRADGLLSHGGRIGARSHDGAARLQQAVTQATDPTLPSATSVLIDRGPDDLPYLVTVTPLANEPLGRIAMLLFRDPDTEDVSQTSRLRAFFGLSRAEAAVAVELSKGHSPAHIAARRGVGGNTLKSQLASVMAKMDCTRQSEVAAMVAALPPIHNA